MIQNQEITITALSGGQSQIVVLAAGSVGSTYIASNGVAYILVTPDTSCYMRFNVTQTAGDAAPTAVNTGLDQILLANNSYRVQIPGGGKFGFIPVSGTTGNVYITPGA